jgi:hypothetical protein
MCGGQAQEWYTYCRFAKSMSCRDALFNSVCAFTLHLHVHCVCCATPSDLGWWLPSETWLRLEAPRSQRAQRGGRQRALRV